MRGMGRFFIGGNWKCNGTVESVKTLVDELNAGARAVHALAPPPWCCRLVLSPRRQEARPSRLCIQCMHARLRGGGSRGGMPRIRPALRTCPAILNSRPSVRPAPAAAGSVPSSVEIVVAPTFLHLETVKNTLKAPFQIAAQVRAGAVAAHAQRPGWAHLLTHRVRRLQPAGVGGLAAAGACARAGRHGLGMHSATAYSRTITPGSSPHHRPYISPARRTAGSARAARSPARFRPRCCTTLASLGSSWGTRVRVWAGSRGGGRWGVQGVGVQGIGFGKEGRGAQWGEGALACCGGSTVVARRGGRAPGASRPSRPSRRPGAPPGLRSFPRCCRRRRLALRF